jgi:erythromycin esterase
MFSQRTLRRSYTIGLRIVGIFVAAGWLLGAQSPQATPDRPASIQGTIKSAEGAPVEGAMLAAIPLGRDPYRFAETRPAAIAHSDREGHFRLMNLKAGGYAITATAPGEPAAFRGDIHVKAGEAADNIDLAFAKKEEGVTVSGLLKDSMGRPLANAMVFASRYSPYDGDAFFTEAPGGSYNVVLPKASYAFVAYAPELETGTYRTVVADKDQKADLVLYREALLTGPPPEEVVAWLRANAIPIRTAEAGHGFDDLAPLKSVIGNARVVALGEATHGTREFFQLKHRMLEFLVEEMGFTVFAIEATMPEAFDVNRYVLTGKGDPEKALAGLYFWTWDTEEVLAMIRWMRTYNADPRHTNKIKFYGFDMQAPARAVKVALEYLHRVDPGQHLKNEEDLGALANPYLSAGIEYLPKEKLQRTAAAAHELLARFDSEKARYIASSSEREWTLARQHARIVAQAADEVDADFAASNAWRDRSMAENIQWILEREGPSAKAVIWAHNGHVATSPDWMGSYLRAALKEQMFVFGFAFGEGSFQARQMPFGIGTPLRDFTAPPTPAGGLDSTLQAAGLRLAAVNLRAIPKTGTIAEWFAVPHVTRAIGAGYSDALAQAFMFKQVAPDEYDGLLFVDHTSAARRLEAPPSQRLAAPANLDFAKGKAGEPPEDWPVNYLARRFGFRVAVVQEADGQARSVEIRRDPGEYYGEKAGGISQVLDATAYRGKTVRLRAAVRTRVSGPGNAAYLWMTIGKDGPMPPADRLFHDGMEDHPITAGEWRTYEISAKVAPDASAISYGLSLAGVGAANLGPVSFEFVPDKP